MKKNILVVAVASAMVAPLAAQAELKLSGDIQFEVAGVNAGEDDGYTTYTKDNAGTVAGGGPNKVRLDFDEKLSAGLDAFGRLDWSFSTASPTGLNPREHYLGLKGAGAHIKFGRMEGVYKTYGGLIDPLIATSAQARAFKSGMTGGAFGHDSYIDNMVELGYKYGGFGIRAQTALDQTNPNHESALLGLDYTGGNWGAFIAGNYHSLSGVTDTGGDEQDGNAKIGGWYKTGGLKLGLQYELADDTSTTFDGEKGDYVMGSAAYTMGNVTIAGWVAGYMTDADAGTDQMSYAIAAIYGFSPRTIAYLGWRGTEADIDGSDAGDLNAFAAGIRHSF